MDRPEDWVADRFGDVGDPPPNDVVVDEEAEPAPNVERPCGEGTTDG